MVVLVAILVLVAIVVLVRIIVVVMRLGVLIVCCYKMDLESSILEDERNFGFWADDEILGAELGYVACSERTP